MKFVIIKTSIGRSPNTIDLTERTIVAVLIKCEFMTLTRLKKQRSLARPFGKLCNVTIGFHR